MKNHPQQVHLLKTNAGLSELERLTLNEKGRRAGYIGCQRCGDSFQWKRTHHYDLGNGMGMCHICEQCHKESSPEERAYLAESLIYAHWPENHGRDVEEIKTAILNQK